MLIILLGYESPSLHETPEVLYVGHDGDDALATIELCDLPRIERLDGPQTRTVRSYSPPVPKEADEPRK